MYASSGGSHDAYNPTVFALSASAAQNESTTALASQIDRTYPKLRGNVDPVDVPLRRVTDELSDACNLWLRPL